MYWTGLKGITVYECNTELLGFACHHSECC